MSSHSGLRAGLKKALIYSLLSFFLVPGITYGFVSYVFYKMDTDYMAAVQLRIAAKSATALEKDNMLAAAEAFAPSRRCELTATAQPALAEALKSCQPYEPLWQFHTVRTAAWWTLVAGAGVFASIFLFGGAAFLSSRAPALSFLLGWRLLILASTLEVIAQGVFAVWLSYWISSYFFNVYIPKLILLAAIAAGAAAVYAVIWIFKRVRPNNEIEGELLTAQQEPRLWARVKALAEKVGTVPPDHIAGGIDTNFFVTQVPMTLNGQELRGRILFVSLPLLRIFDEAETDAVLAHELAHFRGGDTKWTSLLGPKLRQFDLYCMVMQLKGVFVAVYILRFYRLIFEFALKRGSRQREFIADSVAAKIASGRALAHALVKFQGYAAYRSAVEGELFAQNRRHEGSLSIAGQIASGLAPYAASPRFAENMRLADIPHPFDSHPSLKERMANVDYAVEEAAYPAIVGAAPGRTWAQDIATIDAVESKLWRKYEEGFAAEHELALAYRYLPSNAEEEAIVLKHFPAVKFGLRGGKEFIVTHVGIKLHKMVKNTGTDFITWGQITSLGLKDAMFGGKKLTVGHENAGLPSSETSVRIYGLKNVEAFANTLTLYRQRYHMASNAAR